MITTFKQKFYLDNGQKIEFYDLMDEINRRLSTKKQEIFNYYSSIISEIKKIFVNWIHFWYEKEEDYKEAKRILIWILWELKRKGEWHKLFKDSKISFQMKEEIQNKILNELEKKLNVESISWNKRHYYFISVSIINSKSKSWKKSPKIIQRDNIKDWLKKLRLWKLRIEGMVWDYKVEISDDGKSLFLLLLVSFPERKTTEHIFKTLKQDLKFQRKQLESITTNLDIVDLYESDNPEILKYCKFMNRIQPIPWKEILDLKNNLKKRNMRGQIKELF